jgi:hypothetical protein
VFLGDWVHAIIDTDQNSVNQADRSVHRSLGIVSPTHRRPPFPTTKRCASHKCDRRGAFT